MEEDKVIANEDIEILKEFAHDLLQDYIHSPDEVPQHDRKLSKAIENLINRNKTLEKEIKLMKSVNLEENYIPKSKLQQVLGLEEDMTEEKILNYIDILVSENNRLEDIEDRKVQIEYNNVFNKGVKSVEKKIREKIEEKLEYYNSYKGLEIYKKDNFKEIVTTLEQLKQSILQEGDK